MLRSKSFGKKRHIGIRLNAVEPRYVTARAKQAGLSVGEYVRQLVLKGKFKKAPSLPPDVLAFRGQLQQLCSLLHPFTLKRLDGEAFNALERAEMKQLLQSVDAFTYKLKKHLQ